MTEQYDDAVAQHYAAFRPPLHSLILKRVFPNTPSFRSGLDIGCGTGYSTVALSAYCDEVVGLDISSAMLARASVHPKITYIKGRGDDLAQFPQGAFDLITFAGALFYTKSEQLRTALLRVGSSAGLVVVYDFEVHLEGLMRLAGLSIPPVNSDYDHGVGLDDWTGFEPEAKGEEKLRLEVDENEAAHVLLADSNRYNALVSRFRGKDPFDSLVTLLTGHPEEFALYATIYYASYRIARDED